MHPSRRICAGSRLPGVATSGLSVCTHAHAAYSVCLLSLSVCDCHIDCSEIRRSVVTRYIMYHCRRFRIILVSCLGIRVRLCSRSLLYRFDCVLAFLGHIRMSTGFVHVSHGGREMESNSSRHPQHNYAVIVCLSVCLVGWLCEVLAF